MTPQESYELMIQYLRFQNECLKRTGMSFQAFFEDVMNKVHGGNFQTIKPWGAAGDDKCDGYDTATDTLYQVYKPELMTAAQASAKIEEDLAGAVSAWPNMKSWVFVWSSVLAGIPAAIAHTLAEMRLKYPDLVISDWGFDRLWMEAQRMTRQQRVELLGAVPQPPAGGSGPNISSFASAALVARPDDTELTEVIRVTVRNDGDAVATIDGIGYGVVGKNQYAGTHAGSYFNQAPSPLPIELSPGGYWTGTIEKTVFEDSLREMYGIGEWTVQFTIGLAGHDAVIFGPTVLASVH